MLRRAKTLLRDGDGTSLIPGLKWIGSEVQDTAWSYLVDAASAADLDVLRASEPGPWLEPRIEWLRAWIEDQRDLNIFLPRSLDFQLMPEPMKQRIVGGIPLLPINFLRALGACPDQRLSSPEKLELQRRADADGILAMDLREPQTVGTLMNLTSALKVESGDERYERLKGAPSSDLRDQLSWYNLDSPSAYRLLIERGDVARQDARANLLDRFEAFRKDSLDRLAIERGAEGAALYVEKFGQYDSLFTDLFTTATLMALEQDATADDANMAESAAG